MHYEERIVDGVMCHRNRPDGEWIPFTAQELSMKYENQRVLIGFLNEKLHNAPKPDPASLKVLTYIQGGKA